jgi:hypothetical protein
MLVLGDLEGHKKEQIEHAANIHEDRNGALMH